MAYTAQLLLLIALGTHASPLDESRERFESEIAPLALAGRSVASGITALWRAGYECGFDAVDDDAFAFCRRFEFKSDACRQFDVVLGSQVMYASETALAKHANFAVLERPRAGHCISAKLSLRPTREGVEIPLTPARRREMTSTPRKLMVQRYSCQVVASREARQEHELHCTLIRGMYKGCQVERVEFRIAGSKALAPAWLALRDLTSVPIRRSCAKATDAPAFPPPA